MNAESSTTPKSAKQAVVSPNNLEAVDVESLLVD